jgi:hypothetical protein
MSMARLLATALGVVYLIVGVVGFAITGFSGEGTIIVFAVNPVHNVIHLVIGVAALACCRSERASATVLIVLGGVLGLVTVLGFLGLLPALGMHHGIAEPDNFLHLVSATAALVTGLLYGPDEG